MKENIKVVLVNDQELVRRGLRSMLEPEEDIEVVGDCANAEEAFSRLGMLSPDIVLMDTHMPGMSGIEATRRLKGNGLDYDADVIMLAESTDYQVAALKAGASGYLLKGVTRAELAQTIRQVYRNKYSMENRDSFFEEVELVVLLPANAAHLLRFMYQLEETLHDNHNSSSIMHTVGSWDWGTVITVQLVYYPLANLLDKLRNMPDVEKVEEQPTAKGALSSYPKKFGILPRLSISPSKRFCVTLGG